MIYFLTLYVFIFQTLTLFCQNILSKSVFQPMPFLLFVIIYFPLILLFDNNNNNNNNNNSIFSYEKSLSKNCQNPFFTCQNPYRFLTKHQNNPKNQHHGRSHHHPT